MFKNKKLIIFDMDGTLIDSVPSLTFAINHMLSELNLPTYSDKRVREWVGNGAEVLVKRALVGSKEWKKFDIEEGLTQKALKILLDFYANNLNEKTTLYPNVLETLEELKNRDYKLVLATNKPHQFLKEILEHFKIDTFFTLYMGAGIVENKKPHPQMLLTICKKLDCDTKDTVMVGDSKSDILSAKNAGIDSIALTYGYNQGEDLSTLEPSAIFDNFNDLLKVF